MTHADDRAPNDRTDFDWQHTAPADLWALIQENQYITLPMPPQMAAVSFHTLFACERGGACCTGHPGELGNIALDDDEIARLARLKGVGVRRFRRKYMGPDKLGGYGMRYPCPFYDAEGHRCSIHTQKPLACRLYPLQPPREGGGDQLGVDLRCPGGKLAAYRVMRMLQERVREGSEKDAGRRMARAAMEQPGTEEARHD